MKELKLCLLHLHLWTFLLDLNYLVLLIPFYFLPVPAAGFMGLLSTLGVPSEVLYYIEIVSRGGITAATIMLFENRHHALVPDSSIFRVNKLSIRIIIVLINFFLGSPRMLPTMALLNNTELMKFEMLQVFPCPDKLFFDKNTFAINKSDPMMTQFITIANYLIFLEGLFYIGHCSYHVLRWKKVTGGISTQVRKMQKTYFIATCVQSTIPVSVIIIPNLAVSYSTNHDDYNNLLMSFVTLSISLHGTISSFVLVFVNKPYRDFVIGLLKKPTHNLNMTWKRAIIPVASFMGNNPIAFVSSSSQTG